ncbi:alpha/beta hydrolase fold domain-containing protein [Streptomyces sp. NPDC005349]|uniref:alpha/beta hydrolase fold domain-containing protein n=1 Tax=Streptomyces sp. NPDC005349 TaxID=3157037 RepID=UPI0033B0D7BD
MEHREPVPVHRTGKGISLRAGRPPFFVDYRVNLPHQSTLADSLHDARQAVQWVRNHSGELGIDPARIAAGGGSAGATSQP